MFRLFNGCLVAWLCAGLLLPASVSAEARTSDDAGWVPAMSVFSGLVSASNTEPAPTSSWSEPEKPLAVGDTVEIIQVILVPESLAVGGGAPADATRYVIEKREASGSNGGERWVMTAVEPDAADAQHPLPSSETDGILPGDSLDDSREVLLDAMNPQAMPAAPAAPVVKDESERWVPSVAIFSGVIAADVEADVASSQMGSRQFYTPNPGTPANPRPPSRPEFSIFEVVTLPPELVRPPAFGDDTDLEPFIGGQFELMTPGLKKLPGRPRFYVAGDVSWSFGFNRDVAKEGDPGEFLFPPGFNVPEASVKGQGSRATIEPEDLVVGANAGMAFSVDIGERRLRIKPNVGYLRQELVYTGSVNRALLINTGNGSNLVVPPIQPTWGEIEIKAEDQEVYHAIGPGLELEFDAARAGPIMLSVFANANAYKIIAGDRTIEMEGTDTWENYLPQEFGGGTQTRTESAEWKFVKAPWSYRGSVGLRFRWVPE
jgi:hypothetical protein